MIKYVHDCPCMSKLLLYRLIKLFWNHYLRIPIQDSNPAHTALVKACKGVRVGSEDTDGQPIHTLANSLIDWIKEGSPSPVPFVRFFAHIRSCSYIFPDVVYCIRTPSCRWLVPFELFWNVLNSTRWLTILLDGPPFGHERLKYTFVK